MAAARSGDGGAQSKEWCRAGRGSRLGAASSSGAVGGFSVDTNDTPSGPIRHGGGQIRRHHQVHCCLPALFMPMMSSSTTAGRFEQQKMCSCPATSASRQAGAPNNEVKQKVYVNRKIHLTHVNRAYVFDWQTVQESKIDRDIGDTMVHLFQAAQGYGDIWDHQFDGTIRVKLMGGISGEMKKKISDAAIREGAKLLEHWFVGAATYVVCEDASIKRYVGHSESIVTHAGTRIRSRLAAAAFRCIKFSHGSVHGQDQRGNISTALCFSLLS